MEQFRDDQSSRKQSKSVMRNPIKHFSTRKGDLRKLNNFKRTITKAGEMIMKSELGNYNDKAGDKKSYDRWVEGTPVIPSPMNHEKPTVSGTYEV